MLDVIECKEAKAFKLRHAHGSVALNPTYNQRPLYSKDRIDAEF